MAIYEDLEGACRKIDGRNTRYRFDLNKDVAWDRIDEPGLHLGPALLNLMGIDGEGLRSHPEAFELFQWACGLEISRAFSALEGYLLNFVDDEHEELQATRSVLMLYQEEVKHIALFDRYAKHLEARHPEWVADFDRCFDPYMPALLNPYNRDNYPNGVIQHYFFWLKTILFEEYTIYLAEKLDDEKSILQTTWLDAHFAHRQEEIQHVVTDFAHLNALNISDVERQACATAFWANFERTFDLFIGVAASRDLVLERYPECAPFLPTIPTRQLPIFHDLVSHRAFRRTRRAAPGLERVKADVARVKAMPAMTSVPSLKAGPVLPSTHAEGTLMDALDRVIKRSPDKGITYLDASGEETFECYADLRTRALAQAGALQMFGLRKGMPVVIQTDEPKTTVGLYWACLFGGFIPVPLAGPGLMDREHGLDRTRNVMRELGDAMLVTSQRASEGLGRLLQRAIFVEELASAVSTTPVAPDISSANEEALIQFSSGSTGNPKGIALTHQNLLADIGAIIAHQAAREDDSFVSWLPLFHDMGLIGYHLLPIVRGAKQVLMPPHLFLKRPMAWLETMHRHRATVSASPNFGLSHLLSRLDAARLPELELAQVHCILNGAEPISANVMNAFVSALAPTGLPAHCMSPAYGLAEGTLCLTAKNKGELPNVLRFSRESLGVGATVQMAEGATATAFVSVGTPIHGVEIRIVDDTGSVVEAGVLGHIQARGPNVTSGYYRNEAATDEAFDQDWLRTGDVGVIWRDELVITGRMKDVLFVHGRNVYAHDIEEALCSLDGIRRGRLAAFGYTDHTADGECICIAVSPDSGRDFAEMKNAIEQRMGEVFGFCPDHVFKVRPNDIPRTTSGKLQRHRLRERFEQGQFDIAPVTVAPPASDVTEDGPNSTPEQPFVPAPVSKNTASPLMEMVRSAWAEALHLDPKTLGPETGFAVMGGSSIKAAHVHALLEEKAGFAISHEILVRSNTIAEMVAYLVEHYPQILDSYASVVEMRDAVMAPGVDAADAPMMVSTPTPVMEKRHPAVSKAPEVEIEEARTRPLPVMEMRANPSALSSSVETGGPDTGRDISSEPVVSGDIAIIGMACRFPGASTPDEFWKVLQRGEQRFSSVPLERWNHEGLREALRESGHAVCPTGGFLDELFSFDPEAFGMSPEDTAATNPQYRIFLEVAADAMRDAGVGSGSVGVFVSQGESPLNFRTFLDDIERRGLDITGQLGNSTNNMVAAQVNRAFDLNGPAMVVQAACASSLVAVHQARRSLQHDECEVAIAGGVELLHTPTLYSLFAPAGVLSESGQCRPFSADADGFVPGEGAGALVLKRLDRALADGDRVLAVIRGSAVNNDGRPFSQMAPNPRGQIEVTRRALAEANVDPATITMIESHGTATPVGDTVEVRALREVYDGTELPACPVTSVKSNVGHLMAAAGVASLMKVVLSLRHGEVPPIAGFAKDDPRLPFDRGRLEPARALRPFVRGVQEKRRAAINSLGIGGTNCHMILEEAPVPQPAAPKGVTLMAVAATDATRFEQSVQDLLTYLDKNPQVDLQSFASASLRAAHLFPRRAHVVARDVADAKQKLRALAFPRKSVIGRGLVFVFPGPGSQYLNMVASLRGETVFAEALARCGQIIAQRTGHEMHELLTAVESDGRPQMDQIDLAQMVVFAVSYATTQWLASVGVEPDAVVGHSAGEYAAACTAGVCSLETALNALITRGEAMARTQPGGMAAVFAERAFIERFVDGRRLSVAADNAPGQIVVSGETQALESFLRQMDEARIPHKRLAISCAAHSPLMSDAQETLRSALKTAKFEAPHLPFFSSMSAGLVGELDRHYWVQQLRAPVQFRGAIHAAIQAGYRTFVEVGGSAVLSPAIAAIADAEHVDVQTIAIHRRTVEDWEATLDAMGQLLTLGVSVKTARLQPSCVELPAAFPSFPYQRRPFPMPLAMEQALSTPFGGRSVEAKTTTSYFSRDDLELFRAHLANDEAIAPAAWMLDHLAQTVEGEAILRDVVIAQPLPAEPSTQWSVEPDQSSLSLRSRTSSTDAWRTHLSATSVRAPETLTVLPRIPAIPDGAISIPPPALYHALERSGLRYGRPLQSIARAHRFENEVWVDLVPTGMDRGMRIDPALLDGAFQSLTAFLFGADMDGARLTRQAPFLGFAIGEVHLRGNLRGPLRAHIQLKGNSNPDGESVRADITLADSSGVTVMRLQDFCAKRRRFAAPQVIPVGWESIALESSEGLPACPVMLLGNVQSSLVQELSTELMERSEGELLGPWPMALLQSPIAAKALLREPLLMLVEPSTADLHGLAKMLHGLRTQCRVCVVSSDRAVAAMARSMQAENPRLEARVVLSSTLSELTSAELWSVVLSAEPYLVWRHDATGWSVPQMLDITAPSGVALRQGGVYWITGGASGIGLAIAQRLARELSPRLILSSRRDTLDPEVMRGLERFGATVDYVPLDVADAASMRAAHASIMASHGRLDGVVHAAGVLDDGLLAHCSPDQVERVLRPKRDGALALIEAVQSSQPDFLVFISSLSALVPSAGQAAYSAANATLDDFAHRFGHAAKHVQSINYGPWGEVGMVANDTHRARMKAAGLIPMRTQAGVNAFFEALRIGASQVLVAELAPGRMAVLRDAMRIGGDWSITASLSSTPTLSADPLDVSMSSQPEFVTTASDNSVSRSRGTLDAETLVDVHEILSSKLSRLSGRTLLVSDFELSFPELGLDSLMAVQLVRALEAALDMRLYPTLLFEYPTPRELEVQLQAMLSDRESQVTKEPTTVTVPTRPLQAERVRATASELPAEGDWLSVEPLSEFAFSDTAPANEMPSSTPLDLESVLRERLSALTGQPPSTLTLELSFAELGLDSLMAVQLVRALESDLDVRLYPTLLFEYPTPSELIGFLRTQLPHTELRSTQTPEPAVSTHSKSADHRVSCYVVDQAGAEVSFGLASRALEPLADDEIAISVEAWGVNFIDVLSAVGLHPVLRDATFVPGHEVAGRVVACGAKVTRFQVGQRVMSLLPHGGYARSVKTKEWLAMPLPDSLTVEEGASLMVTGLTAIACIEDAAHLRRGESVLIQAAAGATGMACVQLALHHGGMIYGTASSEHKLGLLRRMGVQHPIPYTKLDFAQVIRDAGGVDVVVDSLSGEAITKGLDVLNHGGRFIEIGAGAAVKVPTVNPTDLFLKNQAFLGVNLSQMMQDPARIARLQKRLAELVEMKAIRPTIGHRVPFDRATDAHELLRTRRSAGKIVLTA